VDLVDGDSKIDGKQRGITQIRLKHDLNQQQDLDLGQKLNTTNSETELCKGHGADGCRVGNKYGGGLWDERQKTLEVKDRCKPNGKPVSEYHLMGTWVPDLPSGCR